MAITYNKNVMGKIVVAQGDHKFTLEVRQGNCLAVIINVSKQDDGQYLHTLYSFYADEQHLQNIIKHEGKPFWDEVVSIELNMYYKECATMLKHLVKYYKINCYYKSNILACETNDVKCGKVDLYKFTSKDKLKLVINGIYHKEGKVYATDSYILCRLSRTYSEANEGKIIDKKGKEIEGRYPNADAVIPNTEGWKCIPADFGKINEARTMWKAHKELYKKNAKGRFIIGNQEVAMDYLFMMADLMMELGISEFLQSDNSFKPLTARDNENDIILMPLIPYYEEWKNHEVDKPEYLFIEL